MKVEIMTKVDQAVAEKLAEKIIFQFNRERKLMDDNSFCIKQNGIFLQDNNYSSDLSLEFSRNTVKVIGNTCSGTEQALEINIKSGVLRAVHDGRRESTLGWVGNCIDVDNFSGFNWEIEEIETSRPDWAIWIPVVGVKLGSGPTNLYEERLIKEEADLDQYWFNE